MLSNSYQNQILANLSADDIGLIAPHLEPVELPVRLRVGIANRPISHLYFVEHGIVSIVANSAHGRQIETGLVGWEGITGVSVALGVDRTNQEAFVQAAGDGHRISVDDFRAAIHKSPNLHAVLLVYVHVFMSQLAGTAAANCHGKIEERLARWLLMAHDRLLVDELPLTHEFLSMMLGVHRPGVTIALTLLQQRGLLLLKRGNVTLVDRIGLEKLATKFYGGPEAEHHRLLGHAWPKKPKSPK